MQDGDEHPLDNPVWLALCGPRQEFGTVRGGAGVFDADVGPFGALRTGSEWDELAELLGPGGFTALLAPGELPAGWACRWRGEGVQMIATRRLEGDDRGFVELGPDDADDMLALVKETEPGPFERRTVELGGFIGLREDGRLVAMAGERMRVPGYTELSGVCTLPSHRGRGLAGALSSTITHRIQQRGEEAFLHATATNVNAIRLYESLGYVLRREIDFVVVQAPK